MKKTFAIVFLVSVFTGQVGYYFLYAFQQWRIKNEIKNELIAGLPDSALEIIILEDQGNALEWEDEGKEFTLHGAMFDVVRIKKSEGKTILYCLNDKKEKKLRKSLSHVIKSSDSKNNKSNKYTLKLQFSAFVILQKQPAIPVFTSKPLYTWIDINFRSTFHEINDPPPKI